MKIGFIRISRWHTWRYVWSLKGQRCGRFKDPNRPGVIKTGRWGGYILGFEVGSRG